jgi:NADH-quinone oxidoreductase subunit F
MKKFDTINEFKAFRKRVLAESAMKEKKPCLVICAGTGGLASGSNNVLRVIKRAILEQDLRDRIDLRITGCQGFCEMDPFILVEPGRNLYTRLKMSDVPRIVEAAVKGKVVEDLLYKNPEDGKPCRTIEDIPFFQKQHRLLLGANQHLDPIRITDYIENGGYAAFEKVMAKPDPEWIVNEVKASGLRGRGGAGFPTGRKWEIARGTGKPDSQKYIVCNADEGDPGAYMDRSLLEGNPHAILEGMLIGGAGIGADTGIVYVRSEYPLAIKHVTIAIQQARDLGILGKNILGSGIDFDVVIVRGAGAFVCGEETALIKSVEGLMGEPRQRPPYPIAKGIFGKTTCINNVETLANVPFIIDKSAKEYAKIGVPNNTGTKIFSLVGKIRNTGLVEVPLGTKIKTVVYDIGGGGKTKAPVKAVQTGGPSGGCIPVELFDMPIDYDSLKNAGSIMGSGGMIVMDENTCMVDIAKYFMGFLKDESCGKCFSCRKGTQRMYEILDDITKGRGSMEMLALLEELAEVVRDTTMCGLGNTAANPVLSTLKYFKHEYIEHIEKKHCRAGVCKELVGAPCQSTCPVGTEAWRYVAHVQRGEFDDAYRVIREANPLPSVCARVCSHPCEDRCRLGLTGNKPVGIRMLKRFVVENADPSVYKPHRKRKASKNPPKVAVVGAGPAGLAAAHYLSLAGYGVTLYEAEKKPGGMLVCGIPEYRLPRGVLEKEIKALLNGDVKLETGKRLGKDFTVETLKKNFKAVFIAIGAHKSRSLGIPGEDAEGVFGGMKFLKAYNLDGKSLAAGRVGVIGGGNSALDAARVALRQKGVKEVTIFYRRTRAEMPAYAEEIEAALAEGVKLEILTSPVKAIEKGGKLAAVEFQRNKLGDRELGGRRKPAPVKGSEFKVELDTLIAAIGEQPDLETVKGIETKDGVITVNLDTLETSVKGVFAGADAVTGPKDVINALSHGKLAAAVIDRYLSGEPLVAPAEVRLPDVYIERLGGEESLAPAGRAESPHVNAEKRRRTFEEVELALDEENARIEASRCLRCDLEFTQVEAPCTAQGEAR